MRLLLHERAYDRVKAAIAAHGAAVEPLLLDDTGAVTLYGRPVAAEAVQPDAAWANTDVFFGGGGRAFWGMVRSAPALKWVQSGAAGFDNPIFGQVIQMGARLTTSHGQAVGMADYVLWGVLDHLQGGPGRRAAQAAGEWARLPFQDVASTRWVVLGFGAIGQGVGRRARAFGAHVTGVRRSPGPDADADVIAAPDAFLDLLSSADVVVLCCPLTAQTRHVINAEALGRMKASSVLVNVGRGGLVDEPALLAALDAGTPAHAVLDVFETEPLPTDSRFWSHPRVTLTGHASGMSAGNPLRNDAIFLENLRRFLADEPLEHEATAADVLGG